MSQLAVLMGVAPFVPPPNIVGCRTYRGEWGNLAPAPWTPSKEAIDLVRDVMAKLPAGASLNKIVYASGKSRSTVVRVLKLLRTQGEKIDPKTLARESGEATRERVLSALQDHPTRFLRYGRLSCELLGGYLDKDQSVVRRVLRRLINDGSDLIEYKGRAMVLKGRATEMDVQKTRRITA